MNSERFLEILESQTRKMTEVAKRLKHEDENHLKWRSSPQSWNILECLEHLNRYSDFYIPEMRQAIKDSPTHCEKEFLPGLLGSYFAKSMLPKEKLNRMKTFRDKNPLNEALDKTVIDRFIKHQSELMDLLHLGKKVSLNRIKIKTSISSLLRLKLGDAFQFLNNHNIRHFQQIEKIQTLLSSEAL